MGWVPLGQVIRRPEQPLLECPKMASVGCVCYYRYQLEHPAVRYPHGGVIQKHVCPTHWDGDQALTRLDRSPAHSQGTGLPVVELVVPVSILVEPGSIFQGFDREGAEL